MALDNVKDVDTGDTKTNAGKTNIRLPVGLVSELKQEVGVSQNTEVAPVVAAAISEYMGDDDAAEEYEQEFAEQFE